MTLKDEVELLRRVPLFAGIEPAKLKLLAFSSRRLRFQPGEVVFRQGDTGDAAYVVLSGSADVIVDTPAGEIHVATIASNDIVGEISILCDVTRTATVRAHGALEVLRIQKDDFLRLLEGFPSLALKIIKVLADRLADTTAELIDARSVRRS
ncbi:cyclic nucleotide-binding domain-containing protein [Prosthecomicrobium sp. N25]|uniref:cyclic nucleotide-binding domain-containing protein n=1 Tax=Prosthecomicrobium sp. N25 TaxID=3129254 RepID=UPI0030781927